MKTRIVGVGTHAIFAIKETKGKRQTQAGEFRKIDGGRKIMLDE